MQPALLKRMVKSVLSALFGMRHLLPTIIGAIWRSTKLTLSSGEAAVVFFSPPILTFRPRNCKIRVNCSSLGANFQSNHELSKDRGGYRNRQVSRTCKIKESPSLRL